MVVELWDVLPEGLPRRMTAAEYLALPETKPYLEFYAGEVIAKPMPKMHHATLALQIGSILGRHRDAHGGMAAVEPQVWFRDGVTGDYYLLPDVAYWAPGKPRGDNQMMLPPTLAVEIRSREQTMAEQRRKCELYRAHGVDVCWLIDPERRTAEVFEGEGPRRKAEERLESALLPGLSVVLEELWRALEG